jgi:hypothetical protein
MNDLKALVYLLVFVLPWLSACGPHPPTPIEPKAPNVEVVKEQSEPEDSDTVYYDLSQPQPPPPEPSPEPTKDDPVVSLPAPQGIVPEARDLIIDFEGFDHRPAWPEGSSGVTVAVGYDCGYQKPAVIRQDWHELQDAWTERLSKTSGITGARAKSWAASLHDIYIPTETGVRVFDHVDVPREFDNCKRAFKGFEDLRPNAQGALISLGYNRGYSMTGDSRKEMRNIRDLVPKKDYSGIANEIRKMKRIWTGTSIQNGMNRRRDAEAKLVETP